MGCHSDERSSITAPLSLGHGHQVSHRLDAGGIYMPGASRESSVADAGGSLGCRGHLVMPGASTKQLHKKTASLRVGGIASETLEEKRKALRLYASTERFRDRCYRLASERKKLLAAGIAAEK